MADTAPLTHTFYAVIPATAQGADFEVSVCVAPWAGKVASASYIADTDITGADTNSRTVQIINKGTAGTGTTVAASKAFTASVNATAFDEVALTNSTTATDLDVAEGAVLAFKSLHVGTGLADPGGTVKVTLSRS